MHTSEFDQRGDRAARPEADDADAASMRNYRETGDEDELGRMIDRHLPRLKRWARKELAMRYGPFGEGYASDFIHSLVRDALPRLRAGIREGRIRSPHRWLQNRVKWELGDLNDRLHAQKRSMKRTRPLDDGAEERLADRGSSPSNVAQQNEVWDLGKRIIGEFTGNAEIVLRLSLFEKLGDEEIARRLGTTRNNVQKIRSREGPKLLARMKEVAPEYFK
jgi:DNA-directed RNA polymerase specialized sigma24 family protein